MDQRTIHDLMRRVNKLEREQVRLRRGTVTEAGSAPGIEIGGSGVELADVPSLNHEWFEVGDEVVTLTRGNDIVNIGRKNAPTSLIEPRIRASHFKVIAGNNNAGWEVNIPFTVDHAGLCYFIASTTAYSVAGGLRGWGVKIDGTDIGTTDFYFNTASEHTHLPTLFVQRELTAGAHNLRVYDALGGMTKDVNDRTNVLMVQTGTPS